MFIVSLIILVMVVYFAKFEASALHSSWEIFVEVNIGLYGKKEKKKRIKKE